MAGRPSLTLRRQLKAPPHKVFQAWTDPQQLKRWWRPGNSEIVRAEVDARRGGRYRIVSRTPDGEEHDVSGTYREVLPNEKLVFTWAWRSTPDRESLVTVDLQVIDNGTMLTLTHEQFFDEAARDRHLQGWTEAIDRLEQYCE